MLVRRSALAASLLLALVLSASGCGGNPVREAAELADRTAEVACSCWEDFGFDSSGDCVESLASNYTPRQTECVAAAYDANEQALAPVAGCVLGAARTFHACVEAITACNDRAFDNCREEASDTIAGCPEPPRAAARALLACTDTDTDGDGVFDDSDLCDDEREDIDRFEDEDGCLDPDAYDYCYDDGDCQPGRLCDLANENICSLYCTSSLDCPMVAGHRGACIRPAFERSAICFQSCTRDDDCIESGARCDFESGIGVCN